jgi:hypothetical protein
MGSLPLCIFCFNSTHRRPSLPECWGASLKNVHNAKPQHTTMLGHRPQKHANKDPQPAVWQGTKPQTHASSDACLKQGWATSKGDTQTAMFQPTTTFSHRLENTDTVTLVVGVRPSNRSPPNLTVNLDEQPDKSKRTENRTDRPPSFGHPPRRSWRNSLGCICMFVCLFVFCTFSVFSRTHG